MAIQVILEATAAEGKAGELQTYLAQILPDTRRYHGCIDIEVLSNLDDPSDFVVYETWESREAYQRYISWRVETGVFTKLDEMIVGAPKVRSLENTGI